MIVRDADEHDMFRVVANMRAADAYEVYSDRFDKTPEGLVASLMMARPTFLGHLALCGDDGAAIALLGAQLVAPARANVMMIATDEWPAIAAAATRFAIRKAIPCYLDGVLRSECRCWEGNHLSRRWLDRLGYRVEAVMRGHDTNGATFLLYARLHPDFRPKEGD